MREDYFDTFVPSDQYGFSKYLINKFIEKSDKIYNLRLFGVFGKYEDWRIRFISQTCCRALYDKPITINQDVRFDYMYIDDVVKVTEWFLKNNPNEKIYNVCSGVVLSLTDLTYKILNIEGKKLDIIKVKEGMGHEYSGNNTKLIQVIGNLPFRDMDECIHNLYDWYSQNLVDPDQL
jgi:GDP-L-fucose synthase